jgi:hypothetical protein
VAVRSYQSWLEPFFAESAGSDSPRHALLVKHFTVAQSVAFETNRLAQRAKQTVPLVQHYSSYRNALQSVRSRKKRPVRLFWGTGSEIL